VNADVMTNLFVIAGVLAAAVVFLAWLFSRQPSAAQADGQLQAHLELLQQNRQAMAALEKAYAESAGTVRTALYVLERATAAIAPLTPINSDNKLREVLADIMQPGKPPYTPQNTDAG